MIDYIATHTDIVFKLLSVLLTVYACLKSYKNSFPISDELREKDSAVYGVVQIEPKKVKEYEDNNKTINLLLVVAVLLQLLVT